MKKKGVLLVVLAGLTLAVLLSAKQFFAPFCGITLTAKSISESVILQLPAPQYKGAVSVEEAIFKRKSARSYKPDALTLDEISQILWAAAGKTIDGVSGPTRAYPSAGAIYPLSVYLVAAEVEGMVPGIYLYEWQTHTLRLMREGDSRQQLTQACLGQAMVAQAPASIVIAADYPRATRRYGPRGETRYVPMDVGAVGQNVHLQAEALDLGTVIIGAFRDEAVKEVIGLKDEEPLYVMPLGRVLR